MPPHSKDRPRHVLIDKMASTYKYTYPKDIRVHGIKAPKRNTLQHGARLQKDLASVRAQLPALEQRRRAVGLSRDRGLYLGSIRSRTSNSLSSRSIDETAKKPSAIWSWLLFERKRARRLRQCMSPRAN